jgi:hypothetical protein
LALYEARSARPCRLCVTARTGITARRQIRRCSRPPADLPTRRIALLAQFGLCEPRAQIAVGWGQTRRGHVVTRELPHSRAFAGTGPSRLVVGGSVAHQVSGSIGRGRRISVTVGSSKVRMSVSAQIAP